MGRGYETDRRVRWWEFNGADHMKGTFIMEKFIISEIALEVARVSKIKIDLLISNSRKAEVVRARNIAMYLANMKTDAKLGEIAFIFGRRSHATVLHAIKSVKSNQRQIEFAKFIWDNWAGIKKRPLGLSMNIGSINGPLPERNHPMI